MATQSFPIYISMLLGLLAILSLYGSGSCSFDTNFSIEEATLKDFQLAFYQNKLTSRQLVEFYLEQVRRLNPILKGIIEVNPDALNQASQADLKRKRSSLRSLSPLHGIPVLVKDNIATKDKLNTTAGSFALLGSIVPRDAGVVTKLRKAGAIIFGKASLSEWSGFRSYEPPNGWSARGGQGKNPYTMGEPCGSSSGSAISVAANMVTVSLGTETDGSILCPSTLNSVVGIKPTVGLTSRAGVVPISLRQDTVGPICRTVADAAYVLDAIAGADRYDNSTIEASKYIPRGGYGQFLRAEGLKGKRIGIVRKLYDFGHDDVFYIGAFEKVFKTLKQGGAILVDNLTINRFDVITGSSSGEWTALLAEFKISLNAYLKQLVASPIRSLSDAIEFNKKNSKLEKLREYGQELFLEAEATKGIGGAEKAALARLAKLSKEGFERLMIKNKLDAIAAPGRLISPFLAIGGFPGVSVPAGYNPQGLPFGIGFGGLKGFDPRLIEIAYGFEHLTMGRKSPSLGRH
ncbi:putative amidase isoform X1 [Cucumis melo var. makuwa]|uniref:Amidase isoform X1 n=2 Tax=Cucumis melo TaxID=3656 RepID=A0A5D3BN38_CUCMM|nr:putative amidase isoform X1 [Cucumis melo var. makuwa]TYJ99568.1 putative amidase isoform X1 [Cucumis melo var. makuwa]